MPLDYAGPNEGKQRSYAGVASFIVSVLCSPLVVIAVTANDSLRNLWPIPIWFFFIVMALSILVPTIVLLYLVYTGRSGFPWACWALGISVVGWGGLMLIALSS